MKSNNSFVNWEYFIFFTVRTRNCLILFKPINMSCSLKPTDKHKELMKRAKNHTTSIRI